MGTTVEWHLMPDTYEEEYSLYYERSRSHVVAFNQLEFEGPLLRISNRGTPDETKTKFRMTFSEAGTFDYVCRIYTWMKGAVTVVPSGLSTPPKRTHNDDSYEALSLQSPKELNDRLRSLLQAEEEPSGKLNLKVLKDTIDSHGEKLQMPIEFSDDEMPEPAIVQDPQEVEEEEADFLAQ